MTDTDHLRELDKAATPAPWEAGRDGAVVGAVGENAHVASTAEAGMVCDVWSATEEQMHADATLIAETRNSLSALLDELDALRAVAEAARKWWSWVGGPFPNEMDAAADAAWNEVCAALARLDQQGGKK